jgi:hypothetical protein
MIFRLIIVEIGGIILTGFTQFLLCVKNVKSKVCIKESIQYLCLDSEL